MKYYEIENLYCENINCTDLINILNSNSDILEYYGIIHDCDIKENTGELKKEHYHLYISFNDYGRYTINKVRDFFSPLSNRINSVKSIKNAIQYLVHFNDKNKFQYDLNDIFTNNKDKMLKAFEDKEKSINDILDIYIDKIYHFEIMSISDIINYFRVCNKQQYLISHYNYLLNIFNDIQKSYECSKESEERKEC